MYVIKQVPEDFVVEEVSTVRALGSGKYMYFRLLKRDISTLEALRRLSVAWHVSQGALSCAGNKDKRAVTEQTCGAYGVSKSMLERPMEKMKCSFFGYGSEPVHLGQLEGNKFKIVVRNIDHLPAISPKFLNLFGEQRFSIRNADIGRHIVKREFELAAQTVAELYPGLKKVQEYVQKRDWIGALRVLPRKLLLLFIHAYQSLLWNKVAGSSKAEVLPIVGFGSVVEDEATRQVLREEHLVPRDFVIQQLPEASAEGSERAVWVEAKDLKVGAREPDEFFPGKNKVALEFFLPGGCYATEFIRQQFL